MTSVPALVAALFTIVSAGFGVTMLLIRRRPNVWEYLALPWLLGTALVSLALWLGGFFLHGISLQMIVTVVCMILGALGFSRWRQCPAVQPTRARTLDRIFIAMFVIELSAVVVLSLQHTLGWDGLTVWELKARYAFLNGGALPVAYFSDASRRFSHPEYPLLLPLTETWFYLWLGECDQFWIKLIFPIWYGATMSILLLAGSEFSGKRWLGWIIVLLFPLVPCIHGAPGGVQVGYADLPLAVIYLAAIFYLLRFARNDARDDLMLFVALSATLPWMKREGVILWAIISICGALCIWKRRNLIVALVSFLPGVTVIAAWSIFLRSVHALPSRDFAPISLGLLRTNFARVGGIAHEFLLTVANKELWDIFWLLVLFAFICAIVCERTLRTAMLILFLLVPLACYCASYIFSAWPDFIAHIDTSLPRLLIQLTPIGWLLVALALSSTVRAGRAFTPPTPLAPPPVAQSELERDCN